MSVRRILLARARHRGLRAAIALLAGFFAVLAGVVVIPGGTAPASADGTRTIYPTDEDSATCTGSKTTTATVAAEACRFSVVWAGRSTYGPSTSSFGRIYQQTLFSVYATQGEYLEVGSDVVADDDGDVLIWNPETSTADTASTQVDGYSNDGAPQASAGTDLSTVPAGGYTAGGLTDAQIHALQPISAAPANATRSGAYDASSGQPTGTGGFSCVAQRAALGKASDTAWGRITSRAQEEAGPKAVSGGGNAGGYTPCYYVAPVTGIYHVAMAPTAGVTNTSASAAGSGAIELGGSWPTSLGWTAAEGITNVAAWDISVRASDTSTTDAGGRVFSYMLGADNGANKRPLAGTMYTVTLDGFEYKLDLAGVDPNSGLIYGNETGFLSPESTVDNMVPMDHDVRGTGTAPPNQSACGNGVNYIGCTVGGVQFAPPQYPMFFNEPDPAAVGAIWSDQNIDQGASSIPVKDGQIAPTAPTISGLSFEGSIDGAVGGTQGGSVGTPGGAVAFTMNEPATYQVIVSHDGTDYDPGNGQNRTMLKAVNWSNDEDPATSGIQIRVPWDGTDNDGHDFPAGNYKVRVGLQSGVYHFPVIDVEASWDGGPSYQLVNPPNGDLANCGFGATYGTDDPVVANGKGCYTAFYDDRGYSTSYHGTTLAVGTSTGDICGGTTSKDYDAFGSTSASFTDFSGAGSSGSSGFIPASHPVYGYDSSSPQREWGDPSQSSNAGRDCGSSELFGDAKALDTWTSYPSTTDQSSRATLISPAAAPNDTYSTGLNTTRTVTATAAAGNENLLGNDGIDDRPDLEVVSVTGADDSDQPMAAGGVTVATAHGTVTVHADGTFSYTPDDGFYTVPGDADHPYDTFGYTSDDDSAAPNSAEVRIYVSPGPSLKTTIDSIVTDGTGQAAGVDQSDDPSGFPGGGDGVTVTYTVTNTGDSTVSNVAVDSSRGEAAGAGWSCDITSAAGTVNDDPTYTDPANRHLHVQGTVDLDAGESATFVCTGDELSSADVTAGQVEETATASGTAYDGTTSTPVTSSTTSDTLVITPRVTLAISHAVTRGADAVADGDELKPGDLVTYTYTATNTGSVALNDVSMDLTVGKAATLTYALGGGTTWIAVPTGGVDGVAVGEAVRFRATHVVDESDILAGRALTEDATVDAVDAVGNGTHASDEASDPLAISATPGLAVGGITGSVASAQTTARKGDVVTFTYEVANAGNVTVADVTVDPTNGRASTLSCAPTTLAPGATADCTATYVLTQGDVDAASVSELATASGDWTDADGEHTVTSTQYGVAVTLSIAPALDVSVSGALSTAAGANPATTDHITYTYTVTNAGDVTLAGIDLSGLTQADGTPSVTSGSTSSLAPDASVVLTASHRLTASDLSTLQVTETAVATGTYAGAAVTSDADPSTTGVDPATFTNDIANPRIQLEATDAVANDTDDDGRIEAGEKATFTYQLSNAGNVTLDALGLTDVPTGLGCAMTGKPTHLVGGTPWTFTCTVTLTQDDLDAGSVSAGDLTATADYQGSAVTDTAGASTAIAQHPALTTAVAFGTISSAAATAGDEVAITYTVTNTGTVTIDGIAVDPSLVDPDDTTCPATSLAPGASTACTATYPLSQDDVDAAALDESATASGQEPDGTAIDSAAGTAHAILTVAPALSIGLAQSYHQSGSASAAGDTIGYTYTVTNTGDVTVGGVALADLTQATGAAAPTRTSGSATSLAPGASEVFTATHTVTAADITAAAVTETVQATGSYATHAVHADADPTTTGIQRTATLTQTLALPALSASVTTADTTLTGVTAGEHVAFGYAVKNTGNVALTGIALSAIAPSGCDADVSVDLAPGQSLSDVLDDPVTCSYALTQADVDAGTITAAITATGTYGGADVVDVATPLAVTLAATPALTVTPSASTVDQDGSPLTTVLPTPQDSERFGYTVTNSGHVTVVGVAVTVGSTALSVDCSTASAGATCTAATGVVDLAPGASVDYGSEAALTQADIDAGTVSQTVAVVGTPRQGTLAAVPATASNTLTQHSAIDLLLTGGLNDVDGNDAPDDSDTLDYTYALTNTGNTTLHGVHVDDAPPGLALDPTGETTLAPGHALTLTASKPVTVDDIDAISVTEKATAVGTAPGGTAGAITSAERTLTVTLAAPSLSAGLSGTLDDANGDGHVDAGDTVTWHYTATNTGNVDLTDVAIGGSTAPSLPRAQTATYDRTQTLTQGDIDSGAVTETAKATTTFGGQPVASDRVSHTVALPASPALGIAVGMSADPGHNGLVDAGDTVTLSYTVTNTGATTVSGVAVTEQIGTRPAAPADTTLSPGESRTWTATYALLEADLKAGKVTETATASGDPAIGADAVSSDQGTATMRLYLPALTVTLENVEVTSPSVTDAVDSGDWIHYTYRVSNPGGVPVTGIVVQSSTGNGSTTPLTLQPGESATITVDHHITDADLSGGGVTETTTVSGHTPAGTITSTPVTVHTALPLPVKLALTATLITAHGDEAVKPGDTVKVSYVVRNVGSFRVTHVTVDSDLAPIARTTDVRSRVAVAAPVGDDIELRVGGHATFITVPYTVSAKDLARGRILTSAVAHGLRAQATTTVTSNVASVQVEVAAKGAHQAAGGTPSLPDTGAPLGTWQLGLLGALMLAAGALLTRLSRRKGTRHRA